MGNDIKLIIENAIEIADRHLPKLQDHFDGIMGRGNIVANYISEWAVEAESLWNEYSKDDRRDYYAFIDNFSDKKMEKLLCQETYGTEMK